MAKKPEPFKINPFSALTELKLVNVPDTLTMTHEPRIPLRNYLSRSDDPLRSLAEALSGGRRPKTVEVEKRVGLDPSDEDEAKTDEAKDEPAAKGMAPAKWGR